MSLNATNRAILGHASRIGIQKHFANARNHWSRSQWLSDRSRYQRSCIQQIDRESQNNSWRPTHVHLAEYVAVSSLLHCYDGWSYLSRAITAELEGDPDAARHLGYYAELRAAMALLATDGVGIFNKRHVVVDQTGRCRLIRNITTHTITWEALQIWASSAAGTATIQQAIRPGNLSLGEWIYHFPASFQFVTTRWLEQWGLDISRLADDRDSRNVASYRPTGFTSPGPIALQNAFEAVNVLWEMCEPGIAGGFPVLDRHLLRLGIALGFVGAYGRTPKQAKKRYETHVKLMLNSVSPSDLSEDQWGRFLMYQDEIDTPSILTDAGGKVGPHHPDHSRQVLARGVLLLRLATGSVADHLHNVTSSSKSDLEFWWSSNAVRRGLWEENSPPGNFSDLWIDVKESIDSITGWLSGNQQPCRYSIWREKAADMVSLTRTERAALWGLGL